MDYAVSGALQQRVYYRRKFNMEAELKRMTITEWQRFIGSNINEWRRRLECICVVKMAMDISNTATSARLN